MTPTIQELVEPWFKIMTDRRPTLERINGKDIGGRV